MNKCLIILFLVFLFHLIIIKSFIAYKYIYNMSGQRKSSSSNTSNTSSSSGKKNKISFKEFVRKIMNPKTRAERLCLALMV